MTQQTLSLIRGLAVCCCVLASFAAVMAASHSRDTVVHRAYFRYVASLERRLRSLFSELRAQHIVVAQAIAMLVVLVLSLLIAQPLVLVALPVIALTPRFVLERQRKLRVQAIEQKLDGFVLALANSLRAIPSAGRALAMIHPTTPAPLDRDIELVLREMRVGSTLEQALGNLSARVRSFQLDAAISGLLIGRQTGGDVPEILDNAARTIREMARLQGVLRSKTAEGRAQTNVLAFFPALLIFAFDFASPGYFHPLTQSLAGALIMILAVGMWLTSIVLAHRIMAVEL